MLQIKEVLIRRRTYIIACLLLCVVSGAAILLSLRHLEENLRLKRYFDYATLDYMARQKQITGKWPTNLDGMPAFVRQEYSQTTAYYVRERLGDVEQFHKRNYLGLQILRSDDRTCTILLKLKGREQKLDIDINNAPD